MGKTIKVELTYEEIMTISLSLACRLGVLQTRWSAGVVNKDENNALIVFMNETNLVAAKMDALLKKHDNEGIEDGEN